jgi:hypothetical protein
MCVSQIPIDSFLCSGNINQKKHIDLKYGIESLTTSRLARVANIAMYPASSKTFQVSSALCIQLTVIS